MMYRIFLHLGLVLASITVPLTVHAEYVPPDDVLYDEEFSTRFYNPPPTKRDVQDVKTTQRETSAARRESEQAALWGTAEDDTTHAAAPEEPKASDSGTDPDMAAILEKLEALENGQNEPTAEDIRKERILNRIEVQQAQASYDAHLKALIGSQQTLHSGAPLSDTGPATVIVVLLLAGAGFETLRRVKKAEQK